MVTITKRCLPIMAGFALLCCALPVLAASTLTVSSSGNGGFVLQGVGMESVAALDITITYDTSTLSNPQVASGGLISGAMMAVNANVPGTVRMGIITTSPIKGAGTIATLAFDQTGDSPGRIIAINASITNINGNPLPVQARVVNPPGEPASSASTAASNAGTQSNAGATSAPIGLPLVIGGLAPAVAPTGTKIEEPSAVPETAPEPVKDKGMVSQETVSSASGKDQSAQSKGQDKTVYSQKSVLELFRLYKGELSAKTLTGLFNQEPQIGFKQDPPIVLSDGKATVKISFIAMPTGRRMPEVKVTGAILLSLNKDPDNTNTLIAVLRPDLKTVSAKLVVYQEKMDLEFPIVVSPEANVDLDKSGVVTEADFKLYLLDRGTTKAPRFDLNNDGKRDFVDDYIFTANYLIQTQLEAKQQTIKKVK